MVAEFIAGAAGGALAEHLRSGRITEPKVNELVNNLGVAPYEITDIDCSTARTNEKHACSGLLAYVEYTTFPNVSVNMKLNSPNGNPIDLTKQKRVYSPFTEFYITNAAGVGSIRIYTTRFPELFSIQESPIQIVGVHSQPEWEAKQGNDKNFYNGMVTASYTNNTISYTVPAGKTLYVTQISCGIYATDVANADLPHLVLCNFYRVTVGSPTYWAQGGMGGFGVSLSKPLVFLSGWLIRLQVSNLSSHECQINASFGGYEI